MTLTETGETTPSRVVIDLHAAWHHQNVGADAYGERVTRPLDDSGLVVVDVETTGLETDSAAITEIGAVRLRDGQVTGEFASLINAGRPVPPTITALTGISDAMVARAPLPGPVLRAFLAFADGCVLAAHNAPFDIDFLRAACARARLGWPRFSIIDSKVLAHQVLAEGEVADFRLATLAEYFGVRTTPCHRALADAKATAEILTELLDRLGAAGAGWSGLSSGWPRPRGWRAWPRWPAVRFLPHRGAVSQRRRRQPWSPQSS